MGKVPNDPVMGTLPVGTTATGDKPRLTLVSGVMHWSHWFDVLSP